MVFLISNIDRWCLISCALDCILLTLGITDPEISTKTTDKFRNNILRRNSGLSPDQDDGGASSDSCDTSKSFLRRNDKENTSRQMDLSKRKMKNDEGKIPRGKSSLAIGPKDEEIADLYRELEQANKRAATAQQEQR